MKHIPMFQWVIETSTPDGPKLWECMGYHGDVIGWYRIRRIRRYITNNTGQIVSDLWIHYQFRCQFCTFGVPNFVKQSLFLLTRDQFRSLGPSWVWVGSSATHKQSVQMVGGYFSNHHLEVPKMQVSQTIHLNRIFHDKLSILEDPHCRKPPFFDPTNGYGKFDWIAWRHQIGRRKQLSIGQKYSKIM